MWRISNIGSAAALVTSPAWLAACSSAPEATPPAEEPSLLFSVSADSMRFENPSGSEVTMVMEGVDPHTIWFTDRPDRESGAITTGLLSAEWDDNETFDVDPPNAALVLHQPVAVGSEVAETLVVEMLDATYDPANATLRADVRVLSDAESASLGGIMGQHGQRHDSQWPAQAREVSLFIDSVSPQAIKLCTTPSTCNNSSTQNYNINETIYFQTTITTNVT